MTTRDMEAVAAVGASSWAVLAQIVPDANLIDVTPTLQIIKSVAELSPTALLAVICYMLWKRYTTREDKLSELQERNIAALQRVADVLESRKE